MDSTIFFGFVSIILILCLWNVMNHIRIDNLEKEIRELKWKIK